MGTGGSLPCSRKPDTYFCLEPDQCSPFQRQLILFSPLRLETAVAQWLRYCATDQKVAGSVLDVVMEFFIDVNPSVRDGLKMDCAGCTKEGLCGMD
jgi:hypothetical protein